MKERILKFLSLQDTDFQAALITSKQNRKYFTGFESSEGLLFISKEYSCLLVDFRYYEKAKEVVKEIDVLHLKNKEKQLNKLILNNLVKTLCVEEDVFTLADYEKLSEILPVRIDYKANISGIIKNMRMIKSVEEIECIKQSLQISEKAFEQTLPFINAGVTEIDVACELEYRMRKLGSERTAFDTIAVSGKNTSLPHGVCTKKALNHGEFLTLDFGAVVNGYCSDITRTVAIGEISEKKHKVYETVKIAQELAIKSIEPDLKCSKVDAIARNYIYSQGFEGCFGHGLGHSVGLDIHESPSFSPNDHTLLAPGMVITVEPGIYLPGKFGVRIENMIVVTKIGYINLTSSTTDLITL